VEWRTDLQLDGGKVLYTDVCDYILSYFKKYPIVRFVKYNLAAWCCDDLDVNVMM